MRNRKVGILTQPLISNYGGLIQAFALQRVLKSLGHQVLTINRQYKNHSIAKKWISLIKRGIARYVFFRPVVVRVWPTHAEEAIIFKHTQSFIDHHIGLTERIEDTEALSSLIAKHQFDAYVVGSDQVWRPKYSPYLSDYFLGFLPASDASKRVAYAASFGVDQMEFSTGELTLCRPLAKQFDAIGVREDSGIELCKEYLGVDAEHVLDPTLLLEKSDYESLIPESSVKKENILMTYVLDRSDEKLRIIEKARNILGLDVFSVATSAKFDQVGSARLSECIYAAPESWLQGFRDADYVVTDSFHGTAFSIIFNKPFIVIGNAKRGLSRFTSILKLFGLESRLVFSEQEVTEAVVKQAIDFQRVNRIREEKKEESINFIVKSLA